MNDALRKALAAGERVGTRYTLAVPRRAPMGLTGVQLGHRPGSSLEFMDHREYQPGDDLRRIDWSAYARSDKLTIKLHREEVSPHCDILIDGSASMALADTAKAEATAGLAAAIAMASANAGYTHGAWLGRDGCEPVLQGADRPAAWAGVAFDHAGSLGEAMRRLPPRWRNNGIRILISDLLWPDDPLTTMMQLREGAAAAFVLQVLAESDVHPPQRGNVRLYDVETDQTHEIFVDATAEKRYAQALADHQDAWRRAARQAGAVMIPLVAEPLLDQWDLTELIRHELLNIA